MPTSPHAAPRRVPTNVPGVYGFEPPPAGTDLLRAPAEELHRFGIPHRPDPQFMPQAFRHWARVIRSIRTIITPQLQPTPDIIHGPNQRVLPAPGGTPELAGPSYIWSGLVSFAVAPYSQVWAHWTVPHVAVPPNGNDEYYAAVWVGLGGFNAAYDPNNLLQAGTFHKVGTAGADNYAWIEWYPAAQIRLNNFPITPGDPISVTVAPDGTGTGGLCSMVNLATGLAFSLQLDPPTVDYAGNPIFPPITAPSTKCAEWIVERPSYYLDGQTTRRSFADIGEMSITDAGAISTANNAKTLVTAAFDPNAVNLTMVADDGTTVLCDDALIPAVHFWSTQTRLPGILL